MANIVISFYAPKQTALFALFVVRAVENDRLFLLSVKRRRLSRKSGGVGGESGQLFASGCGEGLRRPRRPPRARNARSASFRFSAFTSSPFAYNRLIYRRLRVKGSPRKRVLKSFVIVYRTACCV